MNHILSTITDLGDSALLSASVLVSIAYLLLRRCRREALLLGLTLALTALFIGALKLAFISCGRDVLHIHSPSGHTALSTAIYEMYALLLAKNTTVGSSPRAILAATVLIALIAASRIILHFHTPEEVAAGILTGLASLMLAVRLVRKLNIPARPYNKWVLSGLIVLTAILAYGVRLPAEQIVARLAAHLQASIPACQAQAATVPVR